MVSDCSYGLLKYSWGVEFDPQVLQFFASPKALLFEIETAVFLLGGFTCRKADMHNLLEAKMQQLTSAKRLATCEYL